MSSDGSMTSSAKNSDILPLVLTSTPSSLIKSSPTNSLSKSMEKEPFALIGSKARSGFGGSGSFGSAFDRRTALLYDKMSVTTYYLTESLTSVRVLKIEAISLA